MSRTYAALLETHLQPDGSILIPGALQPHFGAAADSLTEACMPLFMDRHDLPGVTAEQVAEAHLSDLEVQAKFDVQFLAYWFDADSGAAFCLAKAHRPDDMQAVHREAHGLIPNEVISVSEDHLFRFLGKIHDPTDQSQVTSAFRTILFTDLEGSTSLLQEVGEAAYMVLLSEHDVIIRRSLVASRGREVKHTGDGVMASFDDVAHALQCALAIQAGFDRRSAAGATPRPSRTHRHGRRRARRSQRRHLRRDGEPGESDL